MKTFKGLPKEAKKLKDSCAQFRELKPKEICSEPLKDLIMSGSRQSIIKKYGESILNCFSQNDLKKFLKD